MGPLARHTSSVGTSPGPGGTAPRGGSSTLAKRLVPNTSIAAPSCRARQSVRATTSQGSKVWFTVLQDAFDRVRQGATVKP